MCLTSVATGKMQMKEQNEISLYLIRMQNEKDCQYQVLGKIKRNRNSHTLLGRSRN